MGMGIARGIAGTWLVLSFVIVLPRAWSADAFFDEVYFPDGRVRPQYAIVVQILGQMKPADRDKFIREATKRLSGDTPMSPFPRVLTLAEYERLALGTAQRAETIRRFLIDHYSGRRTYRDKVIPGRIMDEILERSGEGPLAQYINADFARRMRFLYGPDIIRRHDGTAVVLEDNTGFVGAPGDIGPAREVFEVMMPELMQKLQVLNNPNDWYADLVERFLKTARPKIGLRDSEAAIVVYGSPPYGDKEDVRLHEILTDRGVILVTPNSKGKRIVVEADGAYVYYKGHFGKEYKKRIGFLWLNAEHAWVDWNHPGIREKALQDEARSTLDEKGLNQRSRRAIEEALTRDPVTRKLDLDKLERALREANVEFETSSRRASVIPGLLDAILDGRLQTNYTPGMEFIGDKMFHTFVDDLCRFYLREEPILISAPSKRFVKPGAGGQLVTDHAVIRHALAHRETSVIKIVDGRGGDGIYIGPKMKEREWQALREKIFAEPSRYIVQEYSHPSVVDDRIVDIRMITYVDETGHPLVSSTPWTRSTPKKGTGKVNMSQGTGALMTVLVIASPEAACSERVVAQSKAGTPRRRSSGRR